MYPASIPSALWADVRAAFDQISGLPLRVHVTDVDGRFLLANTEAREMFGLGDDEDVTAKSIAKCYEDEHERTYVLREIKKVPAGQWRRDFKALLNINGERREVRFSSRPFYGEAGGLVAMLNITDSMSRVEWFSDFEGEIGVGLFEVNRDFKVTYCNELLAKMLGYDSPNALKGRAVSEFMLEPKMAYELLKKLLENPQQQKMTLRLKRRDKALCLAEMICMAQMWDGEHIYRVTGVVKDVTLNVFQEDELPVGLFLISHDPDKGDIYSHVNLSFAKMHGFERVDELVGERTDIVFSGSTPDYEKYKKALAEAEESNKPLIDHYMEIVDRLGNKHNVVVNLRFLPSQNGRIRVGAVYDLTGHVAQNIRTLEADFGALLHTYINTVNGQLDTLGQLMKAQGYGMLGPGNSLNRTKALERINGHLGRIGTLLPNLEKTASERQVDNALILGVQKPWNRLNARKMEQEKDSAVWTRRNLVEMRAALDGLGKVGLPRELLRNIRSEISEILRTTTAISLSIAMDELKERIPEFYYFRDHLRGKDTDIMDDARETNLMAILQESAKFLEEFAAIKKVKVVNSHQADDTIGVLCNRPMLNRAFHCLLHNGIKYSWHKTDEAWATVDVSIERKQETVTIVIRNWGVAIRKEELEQVFEFGKRGREADDRGRSGTGIGLYDARNIIRKHGGEIAISSDPTNYNDPNNYRNPFITTVTVTLPTIKLT